MPNFPILAPDLGLISGSPYNAIPDRAWSAVRNMRFRLGKAQKVPGFVDANGGTALDSAITGLFNYRTSTGFSNWIATTLHNTYMKKPSDTAFVDISNGNDLGMVLANIDLNDFCIFKDQLIMTAGGRTGPWALTLDASGNVVGGGVVALGGSPPKGKKVRVFQNHVVLMDINPYSGSPSHQTIQWSDLGLSATWSGGEAGSDTAVDEPEGFVAMEQLRDSLMVYKKNAAYLYDYTGFPFTMGKRRLMTGAGPIGPNFVLNVRDAHYIVSTDKNFYKLTLFGPQLFGQQARTEFFNNIAWANPNWGGMALNVQDNEIYINIPTGSSTTYPNLCYIYEYLEDKWGERDWGDGGLTMTAMSQQPVSLLNSLRWSDITTAWTAQTATWGGTLTGAGAPIMLFGDQNGHVYQMTTGQTDAVSSTITVSGTTKYFDFGDALRHKRMSRLAIHYDAQPGTTISVDIMTTEQPGLSITQQQTFSLVLDGTGKQYLDVDVSGRFFAFRFRNAAIGQTFALNGLVPNVDIKEVA